MRDQLENAGYDREDQYFHKLEREMIEKKRRELDAARAAQQAEAARPASWMKCPKCGGEMAEEKLEEITIDRCGSCGGVYFDRGELELLLGTQEPKGLGGVLKKLFR